MEIAREPRRAAVSSVPRAASTFLAILLATGCTVDPVGQPLRAVGPSDFAGVGAHLSHARQQRADRDDWDSYQRRAVQLARDGAYEEALGVLSSAPAVIDQRRRMIRRRTFDRIMYLRQRRWFSGMGVVADVRSYGSVAAARTSMSTQQRHVRLGVVAQDVGFSAFGVSLTQRQDVRVTEDGASYLPRGLELKLQAYAGEAARWPNTKLTGGFVLSSDDSQACPCHPGGSVDLFGGGAHRAGPVAFGFMAGLTGYPDARVSAWCDRSDLWAKVYANWLLSGPVMPVVELTESSWWAQREGVDTAWSVAPGVRIFAGRSVAIELHSTHRYANLRGVRIVGSGLRASVSAWLF